MRSSLNESNEKKGYDFESTCFIREDPDSEGLISISVFSAVLLPLLRHLYWTSRVLTSSSPALSIKFDWTVLRSSSPRGGLLFRHPDLTRQLTNDLCAKIVTAKKFTGSFSYLSRSELVARWVCQWG